MAKQPELYGDLELASPGEGASPPASAGDKEWRAKRRRYTMYGGLGCALVGLVVVIAISASRNQHCDCVLDELPMPNSVPPTPAESFYDKSNVRMQAQDVAATGRRLYWLRLDTPSAVLCGESHAVAADFSGFDNVSAMEMTEPAKDHDLAIAGVGPATAYKLLTTAFLQDGKVYRGEFKFTSLAATAAANSGSGSGSGSGGGGMMGGGGGGMMGGGGGGMMGGGSMVGSVSVMRVNASALAPVAVSSEVLNVSATEINSTFVRLRGAVLDAQPAMSSWRVWPLGQMGGAVLRRPSHTYPLRLHDLLVVALSPLTTYEAEVLFLFPNGSVARPAANLRFTTANISAAAAAVSFGANVALASAGASIAGVSSNYGGAANSGSWGADSAIDGSGSTAWSSNGDGNAAWIKVQFATSRTIVGVGYWTRTMTSSALTSQFKVTSWEGADLGTFSLPDATQMYSFALPGGAVTTAGLRFDVVASSGGNTGAHEVAAYVAA